MSEGGIGWVAALIDRLDHCFDYQMGYLHTWDGVSDSPAEVLTRNFWWCALDDESSWATRDRIGVDHIVVESDYPHADSTWPDTQPLLHATSRACRSRRSARSVTRTRPRSSATHSHRTPAADLAALTRAHQQSF